MVSNIILKLKRKSDILIFKRNKINKTLLIKYRNQYLKKKLQRRDKNIKSLALIVPCYNHVNFLKSALNSIINQTRLPDEIIFINDCSPDKTNDLLLQFYNEYSNKLNVKIIKNEVNIGQSASINLGVASAQSELIMILNDDDYLMHDAIEHTIKIFNQEKDIYLLGSKSLYIYRSEHFENLNKNIFGSLQSKNFLIRKVHPHETESFISGREIDMAHSGSAFLKIAWETVGGYIPKISDRVILFSDRDFQLRVNSIFPLAIIENAAFSFWRINSSVDQGLFS